MICLLFILVVIVLAIVSAKVYQLSTIGINKSSTHLVGKVVIVTGGNNGVGYETAKDLADRGAKVIIGCRSEARGTTARNQIIQDTENEDVHYMHLNLASLASVRKFADEIIKTQKRLDILVNNAGLVEGRKEYTGDGLRKSMQTNHLGPFLLTNLLLPLIKSTPSSRIVNVSSEAHRYGKIDLDNLNMEKLERGKEEFMQLYCNTKLCNNLMSLELNRRLRGTGVTTNALHPGFVVTNLNTDLIENRPWLKVFQIFYLFAKHGWEGAQTQIYLAVSPEVKNISGKYFSDCKIKEPTAASKDVELAKKLWDVSEKLVKLNQ